MDEDRPDADADRRRTRREILQAVSDTAQGIDFTRPLIVYSRNAVAQGTIKFPPPEMLAKASDNSGKPVQRFILDSLDDLGVTTVISPKAREKFNQGEPLLLSASVFGHRPPRPSGGRFDDELEKQIKAAAAVNFFAICKRLQYLIPLRNGLARRFQNAASRGKASLEKAPFSRVYDELLDLPWPRSDHRISDENRLGMMATLQKEGRQRANWNRLFACRDLATEIKRWAGRMSGHPKTEIETEIRFQKTQFVSLNKCRARAEEFRTTENEVCDRLRRDQDAQLHQMMTLVGDNAPLEVDALLPAVYAGDFDPRPIYFRLSGVTGSELFRELGRIARGQPPTLDAAILAKRIEACRQGLARDPTLFCVSEDPQLMSGREFALHAISCHDHLTDPGKIDTNSQPERKIGTQNPT